MPLGRRSAQRRQPSYTQSQIEDCSIRNGFGMAVSVNQGPCGMAVSVPGRPSTLLGTAVPVPNQSLNAHRDPSPSPSTLIGTHVPAPTQSRPSPTQSRPCRRLPKPSKTAEDQPAASELLKTPSGTGALYCPTQVLTTDHSVKPISDEDELFTRHTKLLMKYSRRDSTHSTHTERLYALDSHGNVVI